MKIFLINSSRTWGGGEKWHLETACSLKKKGFDVAVLACRNKELFNRSVDSGITTIPISISNLSFINPCCLIRLIRLFKKEKPDAVILNFSADIKTAGVAAKIAEIRNIIYRRGSAIPIRNTSLNRMLYSRIITHIIANSEETKRTILQNNRNLFPPEKITVIYNGIDLGQMDRMPATKLCERVKDEIIIGNAGRLVLQKGQKYLIDMAAVLKKNGYAFKVLVAGDGPLEASLKKMAAEADVEDHIEFLGFVDNVKAFMETIDVFVLTSIWEGFGYVLVEAMACKKPVVAFDISSNPEIIAQGETGCLVDALDIHALCQKVADLIRDPALCEKLGIAGRKRVEDHFEMGKTQHQVEVFLKALTGGEHKSDNP
jgi:glycosyltransferase involved in cell wall biosynthesis